MYTCAVASACWRTDIRLPSLANSKRIHQLNANLRLCVSLTECKVDVQQSPVWQRVLRNHNSIGLFCLSSQFGHLGFAKGPVPPLGGVPVVGRHAPVQKNIASKLSPGGELG